MKINELDPSQAAHVLAKIKELQSSDGWTFLQQIMADERETFFRKFADPSASPMSDQVVHYNRGIIESTYRLANLPATAITQLEYLIQLKLAQQQATTPTKLTTP